MIKVENIEVNGFNGALRGMRNPLNSWDKSDSYFGIVGDFLDNITDVTDAWVLHEKPDIDLNSNEAYLLMDKYIDWLLKVGSIKRFDEGVEVALIGPNDLGLAQRLICAGTEHMKFMRQINASMDITAPIYWWKEMDTYKIGTTANSTSTMHKLMAKEFTKEDFSFDNSDLIIDRYTITHGGEAETIFDDYVEDIIDMCENLRLKFKKTKDQRYWRALVQILPESYNQTRTWTANYAVLRNIYFQRRNHKLEEWHQFCDMIKALPYGGELICLGEKENGTN